MSCQRCNSKRVLSISGKCSDLCSYSIDGKEPAGDYAYVPEDMGCGGGDYLSMEICLDCGQSQGTWPLPQTEFEINFEETKNDRFKVGDFVETESSGELIVGCVKEYLGHLEEVQIAIAGYWDEEEDCLGPMPRRNGSPILTFKVNQDEVKKTDKEW